jgi:hypothetical protein
MVAFGCCYEAGRQIESAQEELVRVLRFDPELAKDLCTNISQI